MRSAALKARSARLYRRMAGTARCFTGIPKRVLGLSTTAPGQIWVGDLTYLRSAGRWRYLAVVLDRDSRRILGWSLRLRRDLTLTRDALDRAVPRQRPAPGLTFHSLKSDVIHGNTFADDQTLKRVIRRYMRRYNRTRLHSSPGFQSPIAFEHNAA
jgi:transposase InsO family protein